MMTRNLQTIATFSAAGPFTQSQLRWWIFQSADNGLADSGAIVRIGRRIYLDVDAFERWIDAQNKRAPASAAA